VPDVGIQAFADSGASAHLRRGEEGITKSYPCPHCGQRTISAWRRLSLGPARPAVCSACGKGVGVPWSALWLIPLALVVGKIGRFIVVGFNPAIEDYMVGLAVNFVVGLAFFAWMWIRVPLVKQ
jgi:hypothetical protein